MSAWTRRLGRSVALILLVIVLVSANESAAQGFPLGLEVPDLGSIRIIPTAKIGYEKMAINFNFPHQSIPWAWWFHRGSLDFAVKDARLFVCSAGLAFEITPAFSLFVQGETSVRRNVDLQISEAPYDYFFTSGGVNPLHLESGHRFQWWQWDVGASLGIARDLSVLAGVKFDQMSLDITGPDVETIFFPGPENHGGDLRTKMWIPYLGIQLRSGFLRATVIYSPVMSTNMKLTLTEADDKGIPSAEAARFSLKKTGDFLEGSLDGSWALFGAMQLDLWAKATYLKVSGNASQTWSGFDSSGTGFFLGFPLSVTDEAVATLTRYTWSFGFSGALPF